MSSRKRRPRATATCSSRSAVPCSATTTWSPICAVCRCWRDSGALSSMTARIRCSCRAGRATPRAVSGNSCRPSSAPRWPPAFATASFSRCTRIRNTLRATDRTCCALRTCRHCSRRCKPSGMRFGQKTEDRRQKTDHARQRRRCPWPVGDHDIPYRRRAVICHLSSVIWIMSLKRARDVLRIEAEAIRRLIPLIGRSFSDAVALLLGCRGRVVVTGMGKAGIIGQKLSATMSSTGTPSHWVHPAEAIHGDLGRITTHDVIIALSNSGETEELNRLLPVIKRIGAPLIALTGNVTSTLAKYSDVTLDVSVKREACSLNLAPTSSTTAMLAMGDALAVVLAERKRFKERDFALLHPGGRLGRRLLLRVSDLMRTGAAHPVVRDTAKVRSVLLAIRSEE